MISYTERVKKNNCENADITLNIQNSMKPTLPKSLTME